MPAIRDLARDSKIRSATRKLGSSADVRSHTAAYRR